MDNEKKGYEKKKTANQTNKSDMLEVKLFAYKRVFALTFGVSSRDVRLFARTSCTLVMHFYSCGF